MYTGDDCLMISGYEIVKICVVISEMYRPNSLPPERAALAAEGWNEHRYLTSSADVFHPSLSVIKDIVS